MIFRIICKLFFWLFVLPFFSFGLACVVTLFLWISEWYFFAEFESRFNTVAIDYLIYPHEVFTNLRESYPLPWIGLGCLGGGLSLSVLLFRRTPPPRWHSLQRARRWSLASAWGLPAPAPSCRHC